MSLALLLEKYDVSTEEGLQKALGEIEKEEEEVDKALDSVLSRSCDLDGQLKSASTAYFKLEHMKKDTQAACDMVEKTAMLAKDVSAKVRQLDTARSRVAECQRRVHDLIDLQLCSAGVETAIRAHDYETAAGHVARYLSMDPGSVAAAKARGAADPRAAISEAADTLAAQLRHEFEEAARKDDDANVERLLKLFPLIGRADEAVKMFAGYLAKQLESELRRTSVVPLTELTGHALQTAAAVVRRAAGWASHAPGRLAATVRATQPVVDASVRRIFGALVAHHRLAAALGAADPLALEPALLDLATAHSTVLMYCNFLRRNAEEDAASLDDAKKASCLEEVEKVIQDSELTRIAQDLLGHYLTLERFFLEESINKALKMSTPTTGSTSSSLVDDVFFITKKVIRRSISTGSVDGICAILNEASALLETSVASTLRRWVRTAPPAPLSFPGPPGALPALDARPGDDWHAQRQLFLAHANEAEHGADYCTRLADDVVGGSARLLRSGERYGRASERAKLASCAAGLGAASAAFRAARDTALAASAAALAPLLDGWAKFLAAPPACPEALEEDADLCCRALEELARSARAELPAPAAEALLEGLVPELARALAAQLLRHSYTQASATCVERRARRACAWAGGAGVRGAREAWARAAAACSVLAAPSLQPPPASRLVPPQETRDLLARRIDFKIEDIKRLKL